MSDVFVAGGMDGVGNDVRHGVSAGWNGRSNEFGEVSNVYSLVLITTGGELWGAIIEVTQRASWGAALETYLVLDCIAFDGTASLRITHLEV